MVQQSDYQSILIEKQDGVAVLTLNRPERLNAVNRVLHTELSQIFADVQRDPEVRAAVLTGAGRAFCAGGDFSPGRSVTGGGDGAKPGLTMMMEARRIVDEILELEKPLICAINGHAAGLGCTIALLCDVAFMARGARIGDPHVKMGLTAGDGGAVILPLLAGVNNAKYLVMTGDLLTADQAFALGLVHAVVEDGEALPRAMELAQRLAAGAPFAVQSSKASINHLIKAVSRSVLPLSLALEELSMKQQDHGEAVRAFQEKRQPSFEGR